MNTEAKKELEKIILDNEKEGKITIWTFAGLMTVNLDEFITDPVESMLYDLNRDKLTLLTLMDDKRVNDYACMLVIKKLKEHYDKLKQ